MDLVYPGLLIFFLVGDLTSLKRYIRLLLDLQPTAQLEKYCNLLNLTVVSKNSQAVENDNYQLLFGVVKYVGYENYDETRLNGKDESKSKSINTVSSDWCVIFQAVVLTWIFFYFFQ